MKLADHLVPDQIHALLEWGSTRSPEQQGEAFSSLVDARRSSIGCVDQLKIATSLDEFIARNRATFDALLDRIEASVDAWFR